MGRNNLLEDKSGKSSGMQKEKNRRVLALLAAPPGAGKSTLLSFLEKLASENEQSDEIQIIGMDGFHRRQQRSSADI